MGLKVVLIYDIKIEAQESEGEPPDRYAELDSESTIIAIDSALTQGGHTVTRIPGGPSALVPLQRGNFDLAFNICEGYKGRNREAHMPAVLEMLGIPCIGSDVLSLAICLDKPTTKKILLHHGLLTPPFQVFDQASDLLGPNLRFPLMVKPAHEGSSMGIVGSSKVVDEGALRRQVDFVISNYHQPALVEEFIVGREFTVGILGNGCSRRTLPILEVDFTHVPAGFNCIYTYEFKKNYTARHHFLCPAPIDAALAECLRQTALQAFAALGCRDFGRVDFRLSQAGLPYIIEVNPLPGLAPGYSDFPVSAEVAGYTFPGLINAIVDNALRRSF
ncbi:MAG: ATP-grasp domain-containing protein [Peptococcaceae bacterium]|nr:ATP-grasp domain-containing protein [Peptococcaceae bacterium]